MSEWTRKPPTEPGWYWWRFSEDHPHGPSLVKVEYLDGILTARGFSDLTYAIYREWWTTKIEEPK